MTMRLGRPSPEEMLSAGLLDSTPCHIWIKSREWRLDQEIESIDQNPIELHEAPNVIL